MRTSPNEAAGERLTRRGRAGTAPVRSCILTRKEGARDDLIRLALGPDGTIAPDVGARAPGRGAWIGVDQSALEAALAKGRLKGALARAFRDAPFAIPEDLGARIEAALRRAALDRLGLEAKAGNLITGAERIETAARRGSVALLLHAGDAGADGVSSLDSAQRAGGAGRALSLPVPRDILSMALGRQNVVHIALNDRAAAARVHRALSRWFHFIGSGEGEAATACPCPIDVTEG